MHKHRVRKTIDTPYVGFSVGARRPEPRAHGWVTSVEFCSCGARRVTHRNQQWTERGTWRAAAANGGAR